MWRSLRALKSCRNKVLVKQKKTKRPVIKFTVTCDNRPSLVITGRWGSMDGYRVWPVAETSLTMFKKQAVVNFIFAD